MSKIVYTLKKKKNTDELHLFEGGMSSDNKSCTSNQKSICKEMEKSESTENVFTCYEEKAARIRCAEIGRLVCGTCISHFYKTDF